MGGDPREGQCLGPARSAVRKNRALRSVWPDSPFCSRSAIPAERGPSPLPGSRTPTLPTYLKSTAVPALAGIVGQSVPMLILKTGSRPGCRRLLIIITLRIVAQRTYEKQIWDKRWVPCSISRVVMPPKPSRRFVAAGPPVAQVALKGNKPIPFCAARRIISASP